jgi:hypothetical protein
MDTPLRDFHRWRLLAGILFIWASELRVASMKP